LDEVLQTDTEMHNFLRHGIEGQKLSKRNIYGLIRNALGGLSPCAVHFKQALFTRNLIIWLTDSMPLFSTI